LSGEGFNPDPPAPFQQVKQLREQQTQFDLSTEMKLLDLAQRPKKRESLILY